MQFTRRGRLVGAAVAVSAVMVTGLAACSSDDDGGTSTAPSADEAALGTPNKATGTPITFGFITDGKTQYADSTDDSRGATAAAEYANNYLGGVNGHPIQIKVCATKQVPSGGTDCANQMVAAKVSAVIEGTNSATDLTVDPLAQAKIPLLLHTASSQKTLGTPGVYSFSNGLSTFGTAAEQAKQAGVKNAAIVIIGVPAAASAGQIGQLVFGNAGIAADVVSIPPGTADATPQIAAANQKKPGEFLLLGDEAFCTSALKPIRTIAPQAKITITDRCLGSTTAQSIPNGYTGMQVATAGDFGTDTPDGKLLSAALAKYGDGAQFTATSAFGWSPTLALIKTLNTMKVTDVTPANILTAVQTAPAQPYPLGAGNTFQCNGKQIALSPFICGSGGVVADADSAGKLSNFKAVPIDAALFKMPGQ